MLSIQDVRGGDNAHGGGDRATQLCPPPAEHSTAAAGCSDDDYYGAESKVCDIIEEGLDTGLTDKQVVLRVMQSGLLPMPETQEQLRSLQDWILVLLDDVRKGY